MRLHNLVLLFAVISASPAATLSVTMVDPAGKPVPARVYLTGTDGKAWFPSSSVIYERKSAYCSERHFVPPSGAFEIVLPFGRYRLEVERGKEYLPAVEEIDVPAEGVLRRTVRLARWIDMSRAGWYSADMHLHRRLRDVGVLMDSEDLNVAFPITRWRGGNRAVSEDPDLPAFLRKGAVAPAPHRAFTVLNEGFPTALAGRAKVRVERDRVERHEAKDHLLHLTRRAEHADVRAAVRDDREITQR